MAFLDWAGLRLLTEFEFEKACRGSQNAIAGEYAWGTSSICPDASLSISGTENGTETITSDVSIGACLYGNNNLIGGDGDIGPLRAGIFAESNTDRISSGATFYGLMEMSGNLWERTVTVGNSTGRNYLGTHGDGSITSDGYANVSDWPGYISDKNSGASGSGFRGGCFSYGEANERVA
jgi:formylglycine-generating enzyme required for sulfatase activity